MRVHIISMSWTIKRTHQNDGILNDLDDAITAAHSAKIVMFCAAADEASFQELACPTGNGNTITIGAENDAGQEWPKVGKNAVDFFLPGVDVKVKDQILSGSSIATALAAGLAALIRYCIMIAYPGRKDLQVDTYAGMKETFQTLCGTGNKSLEVWKFFDPNFANAKANPEKLKKIRGLVKKLIDEEKIRELN